MREISKYFLVLLLVSCMITSVRSTSKEQEDDVDEMDERGSKTSTRRRSDEDMLDDEDTRPRRPTRINVNFRRAGKKPRVRVRGPPLSPPSRSYLRPPGFRYNPYMMGLHRANPFGAPITYLAVPRGALKAMTSSSSPMPDLTGLGGLTNGGLGGLSSGLGELSGGGFDGISNSGLSGISPSVFGSYLNPISSSGVKDSLAVSLASHPGSPLLSSGYSSKPKYILSPSDQVLLKHLLASGLAEQEDKYKSADSILASLNGYGGKRASSSVFPSSSPGVSYLLRSSGLSKLPASSIINLPYNPQSEKNFGSLEESPKTTSYYYPSKDFSSVSSFASPSSGSSAYSLPSRQYTSSSYPSPYTYQEMPDYREYPYDGDSSEAVVHPYEYVSAANRHSSLNYEPEVTSYSAHDPYEDDVDNQHHRGRFYRVSADSYPDKRIDQIGSANNHRTS